MKATVAEIYERYYMVFDMLIGAGLKKDDFRRLLKILDNKLDETLQTHYTQEEIWEYWKTKRGDWNGPKKSD